MRLSIYTIIIIFFSCKTDVYHEFYDNGKIKSISYSKDSLVLYDKKGSIKSITKKISIDSIKIWNYKDNSIVSHGVIYKHEPIGKWRYYKGDHLYMIREYIRKFNHSYDNQIWYFNNKGDTLKSKGSFYKIFYNDTVKTNSVEEIRFLLQRPIYPELSSKVNVYCENTFYNKRTKKAEQNIVNILAVDNEAIIENHFNDPGKYHFKGYFSEYFDGINDEGLTHTLYFDRIIVVIE